MRMLQNKDLFIVFPFDIFLFTWKYSASLYITGSIDIFVQCDIISEETFAFSGITFSTGSIYLYE